MKRILKTADGDDMFLKEMTIFGFKSFADKINVKFTKGMICVVGPNGCGKSNISDALRWAFGEQSAKKLRGGMMQDVIFGGTTERKPLQMAEVNVILDNQSKLLPIEYNEVEITRRVFRDGDSEYYINKKRCRLKDVQDLITDTGIGMSAYSFIEQGMISQILSTRPEERRAIFEEAAGVMKYRSRKKETINKLASTEENLNRLKDIIYEVERQMKSLERQVEKAAVYKEKFTVLKDKELRYYQVTMAKVIGDRDVLEKKLKEQKHKGTELLVAINKLNADAEVLQLQITEKEQEYRQKESQLYEKKLEMNRSEAQIQSFDKDCIYYETDIRSLTEQNEEMEILIENMQLEAAMWQKDVQKMTTAIQELEKTIETRVAQADIMRKSINEEEQKYQKKINSLLELMKDESNARSAAQKSANDLEHYTKNAHSLRLQIESLSTTRADAEKEYSQLQKNVEALSSRRNELQQVQSDIDSKRTVHADSIAAQEKELQTLRDELTRYEARYDGLDMLDKRMEGLKSGVKHVLDKKDDFSLRGILGDYVSVEKGYERLVDFVLGDAVETIIGKEATAKSIQDFITSRKNGEHVVYFSGKTFAAYDVHPQSILHRCTIKDNALTELFAALLGKVVCADTPDVALLKQGYTVVMQDGSVHTPYGTVVYADLEHQGMGIIERKNTKKTLQEDIEKSKKKLHTVESDLVQAKTVMDEYLHHSEAIHADVQGVEQLIADAEKKIEFLQKDIDRITQDVSANEKQIVLYEKEITFIQESLGMHDSALNEIKDRSAREENEKLAFQRSIQQMRDALDKELAEIALLKSDSARHKAELQSKQNDCKRVQNVIQDTTVRVTQNEKNIVENRTKIDEARTRQNATREAVHALLHEIAASETGNVVCAEEIAALKQTMNDKTVTLRKFDDEYRTLQAALTDSEIAFNHCESVIAQNSDYILTKYDVKVEDIHYEIPADYDISVDKDEIDTLLSAIRALGSVNLTALEEFTELKERYDFLVEQKRDLDEAKTQLADAIDHIDELSKEQFLDTFYKIKENFTTICPMLFNGGKAEMELIMEEDGDILNAGIDVNVKPPGKRLQNINLLSGGEKALAAIALLFSIFKVKPAPFCVLDEIDAPLDDANIGRFVDMLTDFTEKTQFVIISHSKATMEKADALYGVTMPEAGISKVVSVQFRGAAV